MPLSLLAVSSFIVSLKANFLPFPSKNSNFPTNQPSKSPNCFNKRIHINTNQMYPPGQLISIMKDTCRKAFQNQHQRLVTPMYSCTIIVSNEVLGKQNIFIFPSKLFIFIFTHLFKKKRKFRFSYHLLWYILKDLLSTGFAPKKCK